VAIFLEVATRGDALRSAQPVARQLGPEAMRDERRVRSAWRALDAKHTDEGTRAQDQRVELLLAA